MSAGGVVAARPEDHRAGGGATPTPALQQIQVLPIPILAARKLMEKHHYLQSLPGGTCLAFGAFLGSRLMGCLTLGVGPLNSYSLVDEATSNNCLVLTRLWLSDELPKNSESRFTGAVLRSLKRNTGLKFLSATPIRPRGTWAPSTRPLVGSTPDSPRLLLFTTLVTVKPATPEV
jgi:hypothetical protein